VLHYNGVFETQLKETISEWELLLVQTGSMIFTAQSSQHNPKPLVLPQMKGA